MGCGQQKSKGAENIIIVANQTVQNLADPVVVTLRSLQSSNANGSFVVIDNNSTQKRLDFKAEDLGEFPESPNSLNEVSLISLSNKEIFRNFTLKTRSPTELAQRYLESERPFDFDFLNDSQNDTRKLKIVKQILEEVKGTNP